VLTDLTGHADRAVAPLEPGGVAALGGLDRFHTQLLQLACLFDGRLDRELAIEQGVPADAFAPASRTLERL
jgi:hypothetical protein